MDAMLNMRVWERPLSCPVVGESMFPDEPRATRRTSGLDLAMRFEEISAHQSPSCVICERNTHVRDHGFPGANSTSSSIVRVSKHASCRRNEESFAISSKLYPMIKLGLLARIDESEACAGKQKYMA